MRAPLRSLLALAGTAAFAATVSTAYVRAERTVYSWDLAGYQDLATQAERAFASSPGAGFAFMWDSLGHSYNAAFALPLVPWLAAFGTSRLAYITATTLVFHVPYVIVLGWIAAATLDRARPSVAWAVTAVALLLPGPWVPILAGYPDTGAALLFALAICTYVADPALRGRWPPVAIGVCLAGAAILRRHFLVTVPTFLFAMTLVALWSATRAEPRPRLRTALGWVGGRVALVVISGLACAATVGLPFLRLLASRDYYELYRSYLEPPSSAAVGLLVEPFGAVVLLASVLGLVLLRPWARPAAAFVALEGLLAAGVWVLGIRQEGEQYCLHVVPAVVTGLAGLGWMLWNRMGARRAWVFTIGIAALVATFAGTLASRGTRAGGLLPEPVPPRVRMDLRSLRVLVDLLRAECAPVGSVFVVASSSTLNSDLLARAEDRFYGRGGRRLKIPMTPEVDSRDPYPMPQLLDAWCVVVATPLQLHLEPQEQDLVSVPYALFREGRGVASQFERLWPPVALREGVRAHVFRRSAPTTLAAGLATLDRFRAAIPRPSASQPDWLVLSHEFPARVERGANGTTRIVLHPARPGPDSDAVAVYLQPVEGRVTVKGRVAFLDDRCQGVELRFGALARGFGDAQGTVSLGPGPEREFTASLEDLPRGLLGLRLTAPPGPDAIDYCMVRIEALDVRVGPPRAPRSYEPGSASSGMVD